jgi:hypothetical protein
MDDSIRQMVKDETLARLERIEQLARAGRSGHIPPGVAIRDIEEVASGDGDRIVKVGGKFTPDIQTRRNG